MFTLSVFIGLSTGAIIGLLVVALLLVVSASVSGSETAIFSLSPTDIETIRSEKSNKYKGLLKIMENPRKLLATILVTNNFVNVAIIIISTFVINKTFDFTTMPWLGFLIEVIIITSLVLLFGEILPKVYASSRPLSTAVRMVPFLNFFSKFFWPISFFLVKSTAIVDKKIEKRDRNLSIEELSNVIDIAVTEEEQTSEKKFLKGIVKFGEIEVSEIMKSRMDVDAIDKSKNFEDVMKTILDAGYSRIPVYSETLDNIVGILHIKDVLPYLNEANSFDWTSLIRPAFFVPENKKLDDLLTDFQTQKRHFAVVVDEYGGTSGIITMEDVIEEIIGEINDEFDIESEEKLYQQINDNTWIFEGKISLNDFSKIVRIDSDFFDEMKCESESLAGLILEHTGKIPNKMDEIEIPPFTFKIEAVDNRRIKKIRVTRHFNKTAE